MRLTPDADRRVAPFRPLFLNGKFYGGAMNGVHRVADRLFRELDAAAARGERPAAWDMRLLVPQRDHWAPAFGSLRMLPQPLGHTQLWEQMILPVAARTGVLASLANLAPAGHRRKLTMVHDAQFRLFPESYPAKLRLGYRLLIPRGARTSRVVTTVSAYARDSLATFGIADPARTTVMHNGADHILESDLDPGILATYGLASRSYVLLFGSTARYKNIGVVLEAMRSPALRRWQLVVIGADRDAIAAAGLNASEGTVFVGNIDDGKLRALYANAHCLLYPSRTEGFGLPPVEAMWCDCPVIAAPAGAVPEICRDAICYADMDDAAEWVAQIGALGDGSALRSDKIAAGRARAAHFTWRAAGERLVACLAPLVEEAG